MVGALIRETLARGTHVTSLIIRFFHIANEGLPTVVHMDVFDANVLLPAVTQASADDLLRMQPAKMPRNFGCVYRIAGKDCCAANRTAAPM